MKKLRQILNPTVQHRMKMPKWLWLFVAAVLVWSWSLYLVGWWLTPPGHRYFWMTYDVSDYNAHLRWARQAWEGKTRFVNLFTTEEHKPKTFNLHDWFIGKLSRWFGIPLHMSMRLVHTLGVVVFVLAAWWFSVPVLNEEQQFTYLLMLCFLGGVIWLSMPEANTFIALATMSWFVWGKSLAALLMGSILRAMTNSGRKLWETILVGAVSGAVLGNIHPYALAPIGYGLALWSFAHLFVLRASITGERLLKAVSISLPAFLMAGWQAWAILSDPIYRAEFQLPLQTPPFWQFVLNYGVFFPLSLFTAFHFLRRHPVSSLYSLLISWLVGAFLAVYLTPTAQPRKLIEGVHLPMCILASWCWHQFILPQTTFIRRHPKLILILIGAIAPLTFWVSQVRNFIQNDEIALHYGGVPFYLKEQHVKLIDWLARNSQPTEAVLCNYQLGNYIPALTGRRVFIGHWGGTVKVREKLEIARRIWKGELPVNEAKKVFRKHRLRYAIASVYERHATKPKHKPQNCSLFPEHFRLDRYGKVVFRVGEDAIYRLDW